MLKFDREVSVVILCSSVPGIFCAGLSRFINTSLYFVFVFLYYVVYLLVAQSIICSMW